MGFESEGRGFSESVFLHVFTFSVILTINLVFPIQMLHFKMVSAVQNDFSMPLASTRSFSVDWVENNGKV